MIEFLTHYAMLGVFVALAGASVYYVCAQIRTNRRAERERIIRGVFGENADTKALLKLWD